SCLRCDGLPGTTTAFPEGWPDHCKRWTNGFANGGLIILQNDTYTMTTDAIDITGTFLDDAVPSPVTWAYSPALLQRVFDWDPEQLEWDGLVVSIDARAPVVNEVRSPMAVKWRSRSPDAMARKQRGVNPLLAEAQSQIPAGEMGIVTSAFRRASQQSLPTADWPLSKRPSKRIGHSPGISATRSS
ncbi:MAG: hypothetical protein ACYDAG_14510, partial [Chloroflexota bacterium]